MYVGDKKPQSTESSYQALHFFLIFTVFSPVTI